MRKTTMRRMAKTGRSLAWVMALLTLFPAAMRSDELPQTEIAKRGKAATAFVEADGSQGSAFCVHPDGFFLTNEHVVRKSSKISLVLGSGQSHEKILSATVVRADPDLDLALLRVVGQKDLPALRFDSDNDLTELSEVVAFGYPFGSMLSSGPKEHPAVSVNVGRITALRKKEGILYRIQLDATLNRGNSGGPLLDKQGNVAGVVVSAISGPGASGVNFAIPAAHATKFLASPEIALVKSTISAKRLQEPIELHASAVSLLPGDVRPFEMEVQVSVGKVDRPKQKMKFDKGVYTAKTEPLLEPGTPLRLRMTALFESGTIVGKVANQVVRVAGQEVELAEVRRLSGVQNRALLHDGRLLRGNIANIDKVPILLGSTSFSLDLAKAKEVLIESTDDLKDVRCALVATRDGKEVARASFALPIAGLPKRDDASLPLDIESPTFSGERHVVEFPSDVDDLCVAGGGRFVVLHLPKSSKIAVFDVSAAKIVHMIPVSDPNPKFGGGLDKLVIALPSSKTVQRWDLSTFELEATKPLLIDGALLGLSFGSASTGPIIVVSKQPNPPHPFSILKLHQLTLDKLELRGVLAENYQFPPMFDNASISVRLRTAADGSASCLWLFSNNATTNSTTLWIRWEGQLAKVSSDSSAERGYLVPDSQGKMLFSGRGIVTSFGFGNRCSYLSRTNPAAMYVPSIHGDFFVSLGASPFRDPFAPRPLQPKAPETKSAVAIYKVGIVPPLLGGNDFEIPSMALAAKATDDFTLDKRVLLIPQAKVLVTIPWSNDRLVMHRVDLDEAIRKAGGLQTLQEAAPIRPADGSELFLKNGEVTIEGELTDSDPFDGPKRTRRKLFYLKMQAGKSYQIDHRSTAFDAYLRLEDPNGSQVAFDDDSGGDLNARIVYECRSSGTYRIIATVLAIGTGDFALSVRER
jgi:S1-C subfamily serine protease